MEPLIGPARQTVGKLWELEGGIADSVFGDLWRRGCFGRKSSLDTPQTYLIAIVIPQFAASDNRYRSQFTLICDQDRLAPRVSVL